MDTKLIIGLIAALGGAFSLAGIAYYFISSRSRVDYRSLMGGGVGTGTAQVGEIKRRLQEDPDGKEYDKLKAATKSSSSKINNKPTLEEKFFRAGIFIDKDRADFGRLRVISLVVGALVGLGLGFGAMGSWEMGVLATVLGVLCGLQFPNTVLDRKIKARNEEIMFYLPLVIEQISIGVSSSLDVGPCLERVVTMADERDTHNAVTELVRHSQFYVKSGVSLDEAMNEVGKLSGHVELKHAFASLAQVAKHGGEISRQLNDLADAVATQRSTQVEERIKKLELAATGPVALVFVGFMIILLTGFGLQMFKAF